MNTAKSISSTTLKTERDFFEANKTKLLKLGAGRFVLIKGRKSFGFFDTKFDAIEAGYDRFGNVPFFVHKVTLLEEPIVIISHLIGA